MLMFCLWFLHGSLYVHSRCAHKTVKNCERTVSKPKAKVERVKLSFTNFNYFSEI